MIRKKSLLKGTALSVLPGLLSIVLSIISIPIFLNRVGPEVYGGYIIFHIILSLSMILNLNFGKIISIRLPKESDKNKKNASITILVISLLVSTLFSILILLIYKFLNKFFFSFSLSNISLLLIFIGIISSCIFLTLEGICRGNFLFYHLNLANFGFYGLSISLPSLFILYNNKLDSEALFLISILVKLVIVFFLLLKLDLLNFLWSFGKFSKKIIKDINDFSIWMTISTIYIQIFDFIDKYIIKFSLGTVALTTYFIPQQITGKLAIFSQGLSSVLMPNLAKFRSERKSLIVLKASFYLVTSLLGFLIITIMPFFNDLLKFWLHQSATYELIVLTKIFSVSVWCSCISHVLTAHLESRGMAKLNTKIESIIVPFFILGLFVCFYQKNIFYFSILILIKEIALVILRLKIIKQNTSLTKNFIVFAIFINLMTFFSINNTYSVYLFLYAILIVFSLISLPLKLVINEFKK